MDTTYELAYARAAVEPADTTVQYHLPNVLAHSGLAVNLVHAHCCRQWSYASQVPQGLQRLLRRAHRVGVYGNIPRMSTFRDVGLEGQVP